MSEISGLVRLRVTVVSGGATAQTLETERVPPGELWEVHSLAYMDNTNGATSAAVYINGHGYKHYRSYTLTLTAGRVYQDPYKLLLGEGESLAVDMVGTTASDKLELFVDGVRLVQPG